MNTYATTNATTTTMKSWMKFGAASFAALGVALAAVRSGAGACPSSAVAGTGATMSLFAPIMGAGSGESSFVTLLNQPEDVRLLTPQGQAPFTWILEKGLLPPGLQLNAWGTITGKSMALGLYSFTARVLDADDNESEVQCSIEVLPMTDFVVEIGGLVVDALSGLPISGASIGIAGVHWMTALSDDGGAFSIDAPEGEVMLTIEAQGYVSSTITVVGNALMGSQVVPLAELIPQSAAVEIGPTGGIIEAFDDQGRAFRLSVPAGAVGSSTLITVTPTSRLTARADRLTTSSVHLGPSGLTFMRPVEVSVPLEWNGTPGAALRVAYTNASVVGFARLQARAEVSDDGTRATYELDSFHSSYVIDSDEFKTAGDFVQHLQQMVKADQEYIILNENESTDASQEEQSGTLNSSCCHSPVECPVDSITFSKSSSWHWNVAVEASAEFKAKVKCLFEGKWGLKVTVAGGQEFTESFSFTVALTCPAGKLCTKKYRLDRIPMHKTGDVYRLSSGPNGSVNMEFIKTVELTGHRWELWTDTKVTDCDLPHGPTSGQPIPNPTSGTPGTTPPGPTTGAPVGSGPTTGGRRGGGVLTGPRRGGLVPQDGSCTGPTSGSRWSGGSGQGQVGE